MSSVVARKMKRNGRHRKGFDTNPCRPSAEIAAGFQFTPPWPPAGTSACTAAMIEG